MGAHHRHDQRDRQENNKFYNRRYYQRLLQLLDDIELERSWKILTYVISQDYRDKPHELSNIESHAINELTKFLHHSALHEHKYTSLPRANTLRDCNCEDLHCETDQSVSILQLNVILRQEILDYGIYRIDKVLEKNDCVQQQDLINQRAVFQLGKASLSRIVYHESQHQSELKRYDSHMLLWSLGLVAATIATGTLAGLVVAAMNVAPGVGQVGGALFLGAYMGLCCSILAAVPMAFVPLFFGESKSKRETKKLANITSDIITAQHKTLDDNPKQLTKAPLTFVETVTTKGFGFFAKKPNVAKQAEPKVEVLQQIPVMA